MTGDEDSKEYTLLEEDVQILLLPASNETYSYYPDYPIGCLYSFLVMDQVDNIKPEDKFIIADPLQTKYEINQEFISKGKGTTKIVMTHTINDGVCVGI